MIPLRSSERTYSTAVVTLVVIAANVIVFFHEITLDPFELNRFILHYGLVPDRLHLYQLFTSMFIHGGWMHILGNMWFLWVFGRGIEDAIGHTRYLIFYLACGVIAALANVLATPFSPVPTVGASGAIAGVMGAYLIKFPRARIVTLVPIIVFLTTLDIPAAFLLIYWFAIQFLNGFGSIGGGSQVARGDVAWFAHVGGFIAGMLLILVMPTQRRYREWPS
ncbi:MAG TPA: rhomboid family intramembrane serine protease [Bryobacteraceae bacterium]|nr:rhomboid family intramembrane serine protease [Bryobacteraceae bacterium]